MKEENITNEELLEAVKEGFSKVTIDLNAVVEKVSSLEENVRDMKNDIDQLKEGAFTEDEKEDMLTVVGQINQQLRNDTLGKKSITLTRSEYNNVANTERFENRFEKVEQ